MKAHDLRERITIKRYNTVNDGQGGGVVIDTPDEITTWAAVTQLGESSSFFRGEINASEAYEIIVRYRTDLSKNKVYERSYRVLWQGKVMNIASVVTSTDKGKYWVTITAFVKA
jgi:SPP1 family predicted phage head-tail adaptor